jgi:hypothetical protein
MFSHLMTDLLVCPCSGGINRLMMKLHTYYSRFMPEGVAEATHVHLQDAHDLKNQLTMRYTADVTGKPIAISDCSLSQV